LKKQIHIFVFEPDCFIAEKIAGLVSGTPGVDSVTILPHGGNVIPMAGKCRPALLLISMSAAMKNKQLITAVPGQSPETRIYLYAFAGDEHAGRYARAAEQMGAHGFLGMETLRGDLQRILKQGRAAGAG
jgi:hypothetical protein